jgi:SAM-dependent methyltransferase
VNRHFPVVNGDITAPALDLKFDMITCVSVLEHIPNHRAAIRGMFSLLRPGGHVVLTFPYNEQRYVPDAYKLPEASYGADYRFVAQIYSRRELDTWLADTGGKILLQEYFEVFTGDLWTVGARLDPVRRSEQDRKHHLTCLLLRKPD